MRVGSGFSAISSSLISLGVALGLMICGCSALGFGFSGECPLEVSALVFHSSKNGSCFSSLGLAQPPISKNEIKTAKMLRTSLLVFSRLSINCHPDCYSSIGKINFFLLLSVDTITTCLGVMLRTSNPPCTSSSPAVYSRPSIIANFLSPICMKPV